PRDEERHPPRRRGAAEHPRRSLRRRGPRPRRPSTSASHPHDLLCHGDRMVPTAVGTGTGSEFRSPMAIAVIGGVITSTALTLLVVPVIFAGIEKMQLRGIVARLRGRAVGPVPPHSPVAEPVPARAANG